MGVKGLHRFIADHGNVLHELKDLRGADLVIDGNNILYALYFEGSADTSYGGDYDVFAKDVEAFCNFLKKIGVRPYFVFDGASELNDAKLSTSLRRSEKNICLTGKRGARMLPCLASKVCIGKLKELKIPYCVCDHEADGQLASLAYQWNCPLVSNDGDFLLHDLPAGVISVDDFGIRDILRARYNWRPQTQMRVFKVSRLCQRYNIIDPSMVPLLSLFCGNDCFDISLINTFLAETFNGNTSIFTYLQWLANCENVELAIRDILRIQGDSGELQFKIEETLSAYIISPTNHISEYFTRKKITHDCPHPLHTQLPLTFWQKLRASEISDKFLEILLFRRWIFRTQMEKLGNPSSWIISRSIRAQAYQILSSTIRGDIRQVQEIDRVGRELDRDGFLVNVEPREGLSLHKLYSTSEVERLELFYSALGITSTDLDSGIVDPASRSRRDNDILSAVIIYWVRNSQPRFCKVHVMAILICIFRLSHPQRSMAFVQQKDSEHLDLNILHALAQFQSVLRDSLRLLGLLAVNVDVQIWQVFSGRYIHDLCVELLNQEQPELYCERLLADFCDYLLRFRRWYCAIEDICQDILLNDICTRRRRVQYDP